MPDTYFRPGDTFYLDVQMINTGSRLDNVRLFVVLEYSGAYWFWPVWHQCPPYIAWESLDIPTGTTIHTVMDPFIWPETDSTISELRFWGLITIAESLELRSNAAVVLWGFGKGV